MLREECPDDQAERLIQLKELSYSKKIDGDSSKTFKNEIVDIINSMDLAIHSCSKGFFIIFSTREYFGTKS